MTGPSESAPAGRVAGLYVYPVKGLSPQRIRTVVLRPGAGLPHDRMLALARPEGRYRPGSAGPFAAREFFTLARHARLAGISTRFDPESGAFEGSVSGHVVLRCDLNVSRGCDELAAFFARILDLPADQHPVIARAVERRFTDAAVMSEEMMNAVSLINLDSVRDLEGRTGVPLDPRRFRANIYYHGLPPFSERALVGRELLIGDVRLRVVLNTPRCAATEVNPANADRDANVPRLLMDQYGHSELGVYATVTRGGLVSEASVVEHCLNP